LLNTSTNTQEQLGNNIKSLYPINGFSRSVTCDEAGAVLHQYSIVLNIKATLVLSDLTHIVQFLKAYNMSSGGHRYAILKRRSK
jgi:hypothetical protein